MLRKKEQMRMSISEILFLLIIITGMPGLIYEGKHIVKYDDLFNSFDGEIKIDKFETFAYFETIEYVDDDEIGHYEFVNEPGTYTNLRMLKENAPILFANERYFEDFVFYTAMHIDECGEINVPLYKDDNGKWFYLPSWDEEEDDAGEYPQRDI